MNLLQMSYAGALLILGVVLIRLAALRTVPKRTFLVLWALVLVRLLVPFPPLLRLPSLLPEGLLASATVTAAPAERTSPPAPISTAIPEPPARPTATAAPAASAVPTPRATRAPALTPAPAASAVPQGTVSGEPGASVPAALSPKMASLGRTALLIWQLGLWVTAAVFAALYAVSYRRFRRAVPLEGPEAESWLKAHPLKRKLRLRSLPGLASPLTYGVLRPVILLPEGLDMSSEEGVFALEHEYVHARRLDALWKLLLMAAAAVHWFNPFVWLMWFLANRDLELSCDEEVLRRCDTDRRGEYARALLSMEEKKSMLPPLHSGFGAGATKERILSIMKYKKKTVLSVSLAAALVIALAACALGGRTEPAPEPTATPVSTPSAAPTTAPTSEPTPAPTAAPTDTPTPLSGETLTIKNGDYDLSLPVEYADQLFVETPEVSENLHSFPGDEMIFRVSEKASRERWDSLTEQGADTADGWYFSIRRMWPHYLGRAYVAGSSGWSVFARDEQGTFYTYDYPIWLTFCPEEGQGMEGESFDRYMALLSALHDFGVEDRFIAENGLKPFSMDAVRGFLCSTIYDDTATAQTTLRADGAVYPAEWVRNPLSELLWESELTEIKAPAATPEGTLITLERSGGASLAFWPESDLCLLSSWDGEHWYRGGGDKAAAALEMAREIAAREARIAAALPEKSGRTVSYENRGVTLSLPEEYVPYLIVDMPESGGQLFRVSQRSSWENGQKKHPGEDWGDGWLFSLDRFDEEEFLFEVRAHPTPTEYVKKDAEGGYYILRYPSDVRYVGEEDASDNSDEGWLEWTAWVRWSQGLAEEGVVSGPGLTAFRKSFCYLETVLAACLTDNYREKVNLRFLDGDGRELDAMAAPDWDTFARQLLTECSSYASPEGGVGGNGQRFRLVFTIPYNESCQVTVFFTEGSLYFEEYMTGLDGRTEDRSYRMGFSGSGQTVGDLMAKWYREAAEAAPSGEDAGLDALAAFFSAAAYDAEGDYTIRWGEGERYDPKVNTLSFDILYSLYAFTDYREIEPCPLPEGEMPVILERSDGTQLLFWRGSELAVLESPDGGTRAFLGRSGETCTGDLAHGILYSAMISYPRSMVETEYADIPALTDTCTDVLIATYRGSRVYDGQREDDFTVVRALKGTTTEGPITVYTSFSQVYPANGNAYASGWLGYQLGQDYLLLAERHRSVFYPADHYLIPAEVFLPLTTPGGASAYGEALEKHIGALRSDSTGEEIVAYFQALIDGSEAESPEFYGNDFVVASSREEAKEAAPFVLLVEPTGLLATGRDGRETFRCRVKTTIKGDLGNLGEDIFVIFFPGVAEVGQQYYVCVTHSSPSSRLFVPISKEYSVYQ